MMWSMNQICSDKSCTQLTPLARLRSTPTTRIGGINPHVVFVKHPLRLTSANALSCGAVRPRVDGSDNFPTRYLINDACVILQKPLIYGAVQKFEARSPCSTTVVGELSRPLPRAAAAGGGALVCRRWRARHLARCDWMLAGDRGDQGRPWRRAAPLVAVSSSTTRCGCASTVRMKPRDHFADHSARRL